MLYKVMTYACIDNVGVYNHIIADSGMIHKTYINGYVMHVGRIVINKVHNI